MPAHLRTNYDFLQHDKLRTPCRRVSLPIETALRIGSASGLWLVISGYQVDAGLVRHADSFRLYRSRPWV